MPGGRRDRGRDPAATPRLDAGAAGAFAAAGPGRRRVPDVAAAAVAAAGDTVAPAAGDGQGAATGVPVSRSGWFGPGRLRPVKTPLEAIRRAERRLGTPPAQRVDAGQPVGRGAWLFPRRTR